MVDLNDVLFGFDWLVVVGGCFGVVVVVGCVGEVGCWVVGGFGLEEVFFGCMV